jgi:hypothetical protein
LKALLAIAASSMLLLSVPALAQNAGAPGATGTGGSLTGSNTGTSGPNMPGYRDQRDGYYDNGYNNGYNNGGRYMNEGRAAAPDYEPTGPDSPPVYGPRHREDDMR